MWLEAARPGLKPNTAASYAVALKRWRPVIGSLPLTRITPVIIQRGLNGFAARLEPVTVRYTFQVLRTALLQGVKWGMVARNPASGITTPTAQREMRCWNEEEDRRFMRFAGGRTRYSTVFRLALATGLRWKTSIWTRACFR